MSTISSPTPASGTRTIANTALRSAGLIDRDTQMRDVRDKPGGRKAASKLRSHRTRGAGPPTIDGQATGSNTRMLAGRMSSSHTSPSDPLSIRGAARPTAAGKARRNATVTLNSAPQTIPVRMPSKMKAIEPWRELVRKRWNPESRFLNLESMIDDEVVKKYNLSPPGSGGSIRDAAVIFKLASELNPEVVTLSLANNNLTGQHLIYLSKYLPKLANLSLQGNSLKHWKDLDFIAARKDKLVHLRELILIGNPIRDLEFKNGRGEVYKKEITRRFTALEVLDQEAVTQITFDVPQSSTSSVVVEKPNATSFPYEMGPSFITGVDQSIVISFLTRFMNLFDTQRNALVHAYHPAATFSFSANTTIPIRARIQGYHNSRDMPNQRKLDWTPWISGGHGGSRNLNRIGGGGEKTVRSLHIGGEAVIKAITALPNTKHDINGPQELFCVDAFPVIHGDSMGLLLTIHGQFTEGGSEGIRSFDRTFVLTPAPEGSSAKMNGWDVVILSDQWTIRGYSSHEAWKPGPILVQAQARVERLPSQASNSWQAFNPSSLPPDQQAALASLPDMQRDLVVQICGRTGLNLKFAVDCLTGNGWDLEKAIANFIEVKNTLSREAFL